MAVRKIIIFDMGGFLDLGITERREDLEVVLNAFSSRYPEAGGASKPGPKQNLLFCCNTTRFNMTPKRPTAIGRELATRTRR